MKLSLCDRLDERRNSVGNSVAYSIDGCERTHKESVDLVFRLANALVSNGIGRGDRIAVLSRNSIESSEVMTAILACGASLVPIPSMATPRAQAAMLVDSEIKGLFVSDEYQEVALEFFINIPSLRQDLCFGLEFESQKFAALSSFTSLYPASNPGILLQADDEFDILYSSGTTGAPKGVIHSHLARYRIIEGVKALSFDSAKVLISTPLYSNTTMATWWPSVWHGATMVIMRKFNAISATDLVFQMQITHAIFVPVQYQRLWSVDGFSPTNWVSMKWFMSTSAPLSVELKKAIIKDTSAELLEFYGLTEGGVATTLVARRAAEVGKLGSVGQVQRGGELRILGKNDEVLGPFQTGEIVGRGAIMSDGYLNRNEATRAMHWRDQDGNLFYRSGDVGYLDTEGWLFLSDRIKDIIISGGQNIYATDLEAALNDHPDVIESAVVARFSKLWGETPWAFVVARDGFGQNVEQLLQAVNAKLSKIQAIAGVTLMNELPRSDIGKILKRSLRDSLQD